MPISSNELIALLAFFVFSCVLAFILGKGKSIALIFSFYPAIFFYLQFPVVQEKLIVAQTGWLMFLNQLAIFLAFFLLTFLILTAITGRSMDYTSRRKKIVILFLGLLIFLLIMTVLHQVIVYKEILSFFPKSGKIFALEKLFFWLLTIPLALTLIAAKR